MLALFQLTTVLPDIPDKMGISVKAAIRYERYFVLVMGDIMELRLWVGYALIGILVATAVFGGMYLRRSSLKKKHRGYNKKRFK